MFTIGSHFLGWVLHCVEATVSVNVTPDVKLANRLLRQVKHHLVGDELVNDRKGVIGVVDVDATLAGVHLPPHVEHDCVLLPLLFYRLLLPQIVLGCLDIDLVRVILPFLI